MNSFKFPIMFKSILPFLLFFFSQMLFAQSAFKPMKDTVAFKQKVDKMSKETNTIESDFTQVKDLSMLAEKPTSKGHFLFEKENKLRWEYLEPYKQVIVINEEKILVRDENNKVKKFDVNGTKRLKEMNDIMISCMNGTIIKSGKFRAAYFENDKTYKLELVPLNKMIKKNLNGINMYFDKNVSSVVKIEMLESGEDRTVIEFTNTKNNSPIDPEKFTLH